MVRVGTSDAKVVEGGIGGEVGWSSERAIAGRGPFGACPVSVGVGAVEDAPSSRSSVTYRVRALACVVRRGE